MQPLPPIEEQRILAIYAHPDDECYCSGGTLAKYSQAGADTMVISATKGQAGQIHDTRVATRSTLGSMREQELLLSCQQLGVHHVECWDYMDGALNQADQDQLIGDVVQAIRRYHPHIVITFGEDGAYGHPDHVAIAKATTTAFLQAGNKDLFPEQFINGINAYTPLRLYHAHFPERRLLLLDQLVQWLMDRGQHFHGTLDFVHGLSLFAEESTMLNYSNDFVRVQWYPPGFGIIEQGEEASDLYVILSGTVQVSREEEDDMTKYITDLTTGEFFGEIGIATHLPRNAHVIAKDSVTCLIFSPGEPSNYAGRGEGAALGGAQRAASASGNTGKATHVIDVSDYIQQKISAISAHRTQYPITPDMFPTEMLETLFGREFFVRIYPRAELETDL